MDVIIAEQNIKNDVIKETLEDSSNQERTSFEEVNKGDLILEAFAEDCQITISEELPDMHL